jgi:hypothetical protein|tara:strand:+ start:162 stop:740 length:579 start_codon:yes stop_codon:yes gene_type:complete
MYKKLLYNDDCILDTISKKVIFDFNDEWSNYVDWKTKNPNIEHIITKERDGRLKWNQGVPIKNGNEESFYQLNGKLFKKKIYDNEVLVKEQEYFTDDGLGFDAEVVYKEVKYSDGVLTDEIRYYYFPKNVQTHIIFYPPSDEYSLSYYKKELDIQGKLINEVECKIKEDIKYFKETIFDAIGNIKNTKEWQE